MDGIEFSFRLMFLSSVVGLCATFSSTALMFLVTFSLLDAANPSARLATGADCSESLFTQTFFASGDSPVGRWRRFTFVKQLSHFEDWLLFRVSVCNFGNRLTLPFPRPTSILQYAWKFFPRLVFPAGLEITVFAVIWVVIPQTLQCSVWHVFSAS